jgi:uncharacterized membrane protein YtjA (UPF0391 family)
MQIHMAERKAMLNWTVMFLVVALAAALFGFTGIAVAAAGVAKIIFFLFIVLFLLSLLTGLGRRA